MLFTPGATGTLTSTGLTVIADGDGGAGGLTIGGTDGNGGNATGGTASADLADGGLTAGSTLISAQGTGGDGLAGGEGSGGAASLTLTDTVGPVGARTVDGLDIFASGIGGVGTSATAQSDAGSVTLNLAAAGSGSGLVINTGLLALSRGTRAAPGAGFTATITGAPLTVNGDAGIDTARDAVITAVMPFNVNGNFTLFSRSLTETGQLSATGAVGITSPNFIAAERISSGGTTTLLAVNGPLSVSTDLSSVGDVTAQARSVDIHSLGALNFALLQATAGNMSVATVGNLGVPIASATGSMALSSSGGTITSTVGVSSGGNFSANGQGGVNFAVIDSGGTTLLLSNGGAVSVSDLTSTGAVTALGRSIDLTSIGDLAFAGADATAGNLAINALSVTATGPMSATGNSTINAANGISLTSLTSGGTTSLTATNGAITTTDLRSTGPVTASGRSIDIASGAGLTFASATSTAGNLSLATALGLTATGALSATGNVALAGTGGIAAGSVVSGGRPALPQPTARSW